MYEDNEKIIPEAGGQGGADEEKNRWKVPGRTGGMKKEVSSQKTTGLYGAGMAACGNCPLPAGIFKADSADLYPTCCGQHSFGASERPAAGSSTVLFPLSV